MEVVHAQEMYKKRWTGQKNGLYFKALKRITLFLYRKVCKLRNGYEWNFGLSL